MAGGAPRRVAGRAGYVVACLAAVLVLVVSGSSYFVIGDVRSIGSSHAIQSGPSIGAQNILLMGLESRRDWNGNILPDSILAALHAGNRQQVEDGAGGNATNTLILIHIPAGGKQAIGFSIPRDDWVNFAGTVGPQQTGKIDQAYGVSLYYQQQKLRQQQPGISQNRLAFLGNEAGRTAAVATVEKLTGVHIDHFAEVNLDGFYELARVLGGVEVCLNHPVDDANSGADFPAGYQHLDARQALAFVRQRDGLPNGDLDRTHRQQAFIDSVMQQLRKQGVIGDVTKISALLGVAKRYMITDSGWDLLQFATQMQSLTSGNLIFHTLPIEGYETIEGQDANVVNPAYIKQIVHAAFYPAPATSARPSATAPATTVNVLNGSGQAGLAARVAAALADDGYKTGHVGNAPPRSVTRVLYGTGAAASAGKIAGMFGVNATASPSVPAGEVRVVLGPNATVPTVAPSASPSSPVSIPTTGAQGGQVGGKNGIPCVD